MYINRYQNANTTNATVSFGRKMGLRWFLSVHGGGSLTQTTQCTYRHTRVQADHWRRLPRFSDLHANIDGDL